MKKNEFVSLVAERTDMSKKDTEKVIDAARSRPRCARRAADAIRARAR